MELINGSHPFRVTFGQIVVDGDHMHPFARQRVEIDRQGGNKRLTLTRGHFSDFALV